LQHCLLPLLSSPSRFSEVINLLRIQYLVVWGPNQRRSQHLLRHQSQLKTHFSVVIILRHLKPLSLADLNQQSRQRTFSRKQHPRLMFSLIPHLHLSLNPNQRSQKLRLRQSSLRPVRPLLKQNLLISQSPLSLALMVSLACLQRMTSPCRHPSTRN
jgi:hypothetical protein